MSGTAPPFDVATAPLACGLTLLEASAGTGKTHTIRELYLRLVLEREGRSCPGEAALRALRHEPDERAATADRRLTHDRQ